MKKLFFLLLVVITTYSALVTAESLEVVNKSGTVRYVGFGATPRPGKLLANGDKIFLDLDVIKKNPVYMFVERDNSRPDNDWQIGVLQGVGNTYARQGAKYWSFWGTPGKITFETKGNITIESSDLGIMFQTN